MTRPSSHTSGMQCAKAWCLQWLCLLFLSGLKPFLQLLSLVHCSVNVWYVHCKNATKTGINLQRIQRRKLLTDFQLLWHFDTIVHGKIQTFQKYGYKYGRTVNDMRRVSLRQLFSATCTQFRMMNTTGTAGEYSRDHLYSYQPPKWASSIPQAPSLRLHVILLSAHASNIVSRDLLLNF